MNNILRKSIKEYERKQALIIEAKKTLNKIRANSKTAIALLRRDNKKEAKNLIEETEGFLKLIGQKISKNQFLTSQGPYKEAIEEYIEAITFYNFLTKSKKSSKEILKTVKVEPEEIISGICDFTGELVRKGLTIAAKNDLTLLIKYKETIESIAEELSKIGFTKKTRNKYDAVERNLKRIEEIIYDIKLKK